MVAPEPMASIAMAATAVQAGMEVLMAMAAMVARGVVQTAQMQMPLVAWVVPAVPLERYPETAASVATEATQS